MNFEKNNMHDIFDKIPFYPMDPIEEVEKEYSKEKSEKRLFLGSGTLHNDRNEIHQFEVVKRAEEKLLKKNLDKDYLFPEGDREFIELARNFCFGSEDISKEYGNKIISIQTPGATGAIRLALNFMKKFMEAKVYIPSPTWPLASLIAKEVDLEYELIDSFDLNKQQLKFDNIVYALSNAKNGSILFMQDIANSPTGEDPSPDQWSQIMKIAAEKDLRLLLDSAFQGFSSGDLVSDSWVVRMFLESKLQFFVAQTFSKNLGLYGERIGCLHVICKSPDDIERIKSQFDHRIRCLWLAPNIHGMRIVKTIIKDKELFEMWKKEFSDEVRRLKECRRLLKDQLNKIEAKGNWDNLTNHCGLFVQLPFNEKQVELLKKKYKLYTVKSGRINISAINHKDVDSVAMAIKEVLENKQLLQ